MRSTTIALFSLLLLLGCSKTETLSLPALFTDNMVLQRNATVQFWGVAGSIPKFRLAHHGVSTKERQMFLENGKLDFRLQMKTHRSA